MAQFIARSIFTFTSKAKILKTNICVTEAEKGGGERERDERSKPSYLLRHMLRIPLDKEICDTSTKKMHQKQSTRAAMK